LNPRSAEAYYSKSEALRILDEEEEAQECYEKALELGYNA